MRKFLLGVMVVLVAEALAGFVFLKLGLVPTEASAQPSALETKVATMALNASLARRAPRSGNPAQPTEADLQKGLMLYKRACSDCHGLPGRDSVYGASFYPPAPQFATHPPRRPEAEVHYIVKHGIRNTGMAAWGNAIPDDQVGKVAEFLSRLDALPPSVEGEWRKPQP